MSPDEIERLRAEGERMAEMFAKDVYIESANLEPGHYDLRLKGKGCMLLAGQLTQMFYDSGGKNFITSSIEHQFSDGKDVFALTIQKMSGDDTPAQKLERQAKRIAELEAEKKRRLYNYRYRFCFLRSERDAALAAYPKRIAKQRAALVKERAWNLYNAETQGVRQDPPYQDVVGRYEQEARESLERIKAGDANGMEN